MSTSASVLEKPTTTGNPPPRLIHLVCKCMDGITGTRTAMCGAKVGGPIYRIKPDTHPAMDLCQVCYGLRASHATCPVCGGTF